MLFFDTFEQLATDAVPWLLNHFLEADVSTNVVLVVAGRDSIEDSTPDNLKQWLPYIDNNIIYFVSLNSFTEEETRLYLQERGITDTERITLFWQLSRGLPLYLGMLTSNPQGKIDPTTNVVANFLRWIPEHDHVKRLGNQANISAKQIAQHLLQYIEEDLRSQDFLKAVNYLLEKVASQSSFPKVLLARLYNNRGRMYISISYGNHPQEYSRGSKGALSAYHQAIKDFTCAIDLDPGFVPAYTNRGRVYRLQGDLKLSLNDINHAIELDPTYMWAHYHRGKAHIVLHEYASAITDFDQACKLTPNYGWPFAQRGFAYLYAKEYHHAVKDLNRAIALNTTYAWIYSSRGFAYLWLGDLQQARKSYIKSWQAAPNNITSSWTAEWISMYQSFPDHAVAEQLEQLAAIDPAHSLAPLCRGVAQWVRGNFEQALVEIEQSLVMTPQEWSGYFWKGMVLASLGQDQDALAAVRKALEGGLPPILLSSWRWLKETRPSFWEEYIEHLLI